ncbi:MAG: isopentenyl phosphate kinase [Methanosarcinales archaeon]|nr:isopentenyl phosphate kinase [ANME-2 cluster archaeon]MDF1531038.1 isopentenyl phosphate kinase [ANME-2 cluster archaeon]MDW7775494.1 isopentenyl phosphate kinase [Methanosarcinales archaeon]
MNRPVVLKIGGSIITDKSSAVPKAIPGTIERIAREVAATGADNPLILVHGAGSFGHPLARQFKLIEQFDTKGLIETHRSVKTLNAMVMDAFVSAGVPAVPVHPLSCTMLREGRISDMQTAPLREMLNRGLVPVLHGDVAMDSVRGADILSGDQIVPYIAREMGAGLIGIGSNINGVLDSEEKNIPEVTPATFDGIRKYIGGSSHTDVTGGMLGKVQELVELADKSGISSRIFDASATGSITGFLQGETMGTLIQKNK